VLQPGPSSIHPPTLRSADPGAGGRGVPPQLRDGKEAVQVGNAFENGIFAQAAGRFRCAHLPGGPNEKKPGKTPAVEVITSVSADLLDGRFGFRAGRIDRLSCLDALRFDRH
jgi:hypothetical protein